MNNLVSILKKRIFWSLQIWRDLILVIPKILILVLLIKRFNFLELVSTVRGGLPLIDNVTDDVPHDQSHMYKTIIFKPIY